MGTESEMALEIDQIRCPSCGGRVRYQADCPGYLQGEPDATRVVVCSPRCGNAHYWECAGEGSKPSCGWSYREPNNRRDGRGVKPDWLEWIRSTLESSVDLDDKPEWETVG